MSPFPAHAFDWTPDTTRYLSDPAFLPGQWQVESLSQYEYSNHNETWKNLAGAKTEHYFDVGNKLSQSFFLGLTDRLRLSGSADYSASRSKYNYYGTQPTFESSDHAFSDPSFGLTYRAIDQRSSPISVDGSLRYTPAVNSGTGQTEYVEVAVSREMKSATILGFVAATHYDSYSTPDVFSATTQSVGSSWLYNVGIDTQLRLSRRCDVNSGFSININANRSYSNAALGNAFLDEHGASFEPYVTLLFQIVPNRAVAGLQYEHDFIGDDHRSGSFNGTWTDQAENIYTANLRLLF